MPEPRFFLLDVIPQHANDCGHLGAQRLFSFVNGEAAFPQFVARVLTIALISEGLHPTLSFKGGLPYLVRPRQKEAEMTEVSEFLQGLELAERIRRICSEDRVDCAVAFLGRGMRAELFPRPNQVVRIVCDIAMCCTSQKALIEFGAPAGPHGTGNSNLHVRDWIHTKVYLSAAGAVIGSPNLSAKALGARGQAPGNLEAGTFHPVKSKVWVEAKAWFEELFTSTDVIEWRDVERAAKYSNDPGRQHDPVDLPNMSLLDRIRHNPEDYKAVSFVVTTEDLTVEAEEALKDGERVGDTSQLSVVAWSEEAKWSDVEKSIIAFHRYDAGGQSMDGYVRCRPSGEQDCLLLFGVKGWNSLRRAHTQVGLKKPLTARDWRLINLLWEGDQTIFSAAEFAEALDTAARTVEQGA